MYIIDESSFFTIYPGRYSIYKDFNVPFNGKNESIRNIIKKDKDIICSMLDEVKTANDKAKTDTKQYLEDIGRILKMNYGS